MDYAFIAMNQIEEVSHDCGLDAHDAIPNGQFYEVELPNVETSPFLYMGMCLMVLLYL